MSSKQMHLSLILVLILLLIPVFPGFAQNGISVYYKNFVRHSNGEFCTHTPPEATLTAFMNNDQSKILTENAPRWTPGEPNIAGNGTFGVELGNFINPVLAVGDSVFVRFTCNATEEQGTLCDSVTAIPWLVFPITLYLNPVNLPGSPGGVSLEFNANQQRVITWSQKPGMTYSVYRRGVEDTLASGVSRMLYTRLAGNIIAGSFIDTTSNTSRHGYIVYAKAGNSYSSHSAEVTDYPFPPRNVEAAVAYSNPFKVAIMWEEPLGQPNLMYRLYKSDAPGVPLDPAHLLGETTELAFLDSLVTGGETYYYRLVSINALGLESDPSEEVSVTVEVFANGEPDLSVLYISRSPRYKRFDIVYGPPGYNPHPRPGSEDDKRYPNTGEMMTYTAVIRNNGGGTVESFQANWYADGVLFQTENFGQLFPRQRLTSSIQKPWGSQPSLIKCEVQPLPPVNEVTTENNIRQIRSNALTFRFHAEENILTLFENHLNPAGSYNFEDWAQVQVKKLNDFFAEAIYPITPNGVPEAVFLDTLLYYENGMLPPGGTHAPHSLWWDGQWGFTGDSGAINYFQNIVLGQQNGMDWALLHELGHQLGLIDLYNQDVQESEFLVIEPRTGQKPPLTPIAWDVLYYSSRSNYLMHSNFQNGLSDFSAGGLLRNLSKRRGYFGDYMADIPGENTFHIKRQDGTPIHNAEVWVYQQQDNTVPNIPKFRGMTDAQGYYHFPHVTDTLYEGGIAVANPFSTIHSPAPHAVGTNSVLFVRVTKGDSVGYRFIDICDFNVAYWAGNHNAATYSLKISRWFNIPPAGVEESENSIPKTYQLFQNYPNPFNPATEIEYQLPKASEVELAIYNVLGEKVRILVQEKKDPGVHQVRWDGINDRGIPVSSGIYFYRLSAGNYKSVRKMILIR
jgi:hypothetical protein